MLRTHTWSAFAFNYVLNFTYSPSCTPLLAEVNCVVVLVTQYEFRSHGVCVQRNKFLLTQPPPPWVTPGWEAHEAPTNTGHCTYQVIRAQVLKNTISENLWSQSVCVRRPENQTFQVPVSCHFNSRFIYIRRKSRTFWGFPEVIPTDTSKRIF